MFHLKNAGEKSYVDQEFNKYVREIKVLFRKCGYSNYVDKIKRSDIKFKELVASYGQCHPFSNKIYIDLDTWNFMTDSSREELLLHEFGHCVLMKDHYGKGIMAPHGMLYDKYIRDYNKYINEYFGCSLEKPCCNVEWDGKKYH